MIGDIMQPTHLLFVLVIALLVLGPKRLPEVARQLGRGINDFRAAINGERDDPQPEDDIALASAQAEPAAQPTASTAPAGASLSTVEETDLTPDLQRANDGVEHPLAEPESARSGPEPSAGDEPVAGSPETVASNGLADSPAQAAASDDLANDPPPAAPVNGLSHNAPDTAPPGDLPDEVPERAAANGVAHEPPAPVENPSDPVA